MSEPRQRPDDDRGLWILALGFGGACRAVVLAATRRLADGFPAIDYADNRGVPYAVALNTFADAPTYDLAEVRQALRIPGHLPLLTCDARDRYEVRQTLIGLVEHALTRRRPALPPWRRSGGLWRAATPNAWRRCCM